MSELLSYLEVYAEYRPGEGMVTVFRFNDFESFFDAGTCAAALAVLDMAS